MSLADTTHVPASRSRPAVSTTTRDLMILFTVLMFIAAWGLSVFTFGIPGLYIPALAMVPVIWTCLILITWG
ncbi:hypothetical protein KUD11_06030 [Roseovarius sp. LXJ103]|uniref:hypothetical protein n=1 Tax=Roseovarius carneus TaxID=2853164 RepID=UPI000D60AFD7|nr:hypothetical protein [Roseovarius carneus]MBZ8118203.1 hypothetical protein [Roseovarius carneus]PWE36070.1 hypothetical protein DD563_08940 [Pelagicola sp. LXJ1103]